MPYVLIAYDHTDDDAPARRQAARAARLKSIEEQVAKGTMIYGGAMLDEDGQPIGSVIVTDFATLDEAEAWLMSDAYISQEVWDKGRCIFIETKTAPAFEGVKPTPKAA